VQTGVPPWLFMPELPPEGATQQCTLGAGPAQQQQHVEPEPTPTEATHQSWLSSVGHSLGGHGRNRKDT